MAKGQFWDGITERASEVDARKSGYSILAVAMALIDGLLFAISGCFGALTTFSLGGFGFVILGAVSVTMLGIGVTMLAGAAFLHTARREGAANALMFSGALAAFFSLVGVVLDLFNARAGINGPLLIRLLLEVLMMACAGILVFALIKRSGA